MTRIPKTERVASCQRLISQMMIVEKINPQTAVAALFDMACSLACASRRLDISRVDFRDSLLDAIRNAINVYLDDPKLQAMAEEYNEGYARYLQRTNRKSDVGSSTESI